MVSSIKIREMFDAVAPGYDRANQVLSLGVHHRWRHKLVRAANIRASESVLDCATGTGDVAFALENEVGRSGRVVGIDFSWPMLAIAQGKRNDRHSRVPFVVGDVLNLPFLENEFNAATIAFGIRNVDDPVAGLTEMARVVKPGGRVAVLEFGQPDAALAAKCYRWYSRAVLPKIGGWITGQPSSYRYLAESASAFPAGQSFVELMQASGAFASVRQIPLSLKIAYVYVGIVA